MKNIFQKNGNIIGKRSSKERRIFADPDFRGFERRIAPDRRSGTERRKSLRIMYLNIEKPIFKMGKYKFKVIDISQRGIKFINNKEEILPEYIGGKLTFLYGGSIAIEGSVIWEQDDDFGIYLKNVIPVSMIQKEELYIQKQLSSRSS